ncbi:MAG: hypothetical protein J7L11_09755 [Thermoprotei archaeon]|nr:hypothetical protein [Thermoprotei archaeon]
MRSSEEMEIDNVTFGTMNEMKKVEAKERVIRTVYFLKRRLQSKPRLNEKSILAKYRGSGGLRRYTSSMKREGKNTHYESSG